MGSGSMKWTAALLSVAMVGHVGAGEIETLDPLEVTAVPERTHRIGDVDLAETPAVVTVIRRERFEGSLTSLGEVIEAETGVQVRRSGGLGSISEASLRGASSQQVMVYLDGLPLNQAFGGGVDLSRVSLAAVGAIEIYRGITPIQFSRASLGGAINIRTPRASEGNRTSTNVGFGSFRTVEAGLLHQGEHRGWETVLSADYLNSKNNFTFVNDNGTDLNPGDDREEQRNNAQVERGGGLFKTGRRLGDDVRLDLMVTGFGRDQGLPSVDNSPDTVATLDTREFNGNLRLSAETLADSPWNGSLRLYGGTVRENFDDSLAQIGQIATDTLDHTHRYGAQVYAERAAVDSTIAAILDVSRETYESEDQLDRRETREASRNSLEAGMQASLFWFDQRLLIVPALRCLVNQDAFGDPSGPRTESWWSPQLGLKYEVTPGLDLQANAGRYARPPSFFELFGDRGFIIGNSELEAESAINLDLGLLYDAYAPAAWLDSVELRATGFYSDVDDLIAFVFDARGVGRPVNISSASIIGLELGTTLTFPSDTLMTVNATFLNPENSSDVAAFDGKRLPGRYTTDLYLRLDQFLGRFKFYYEFLYQSGLFYDRANLLPATSVNKHSVGVAGEFGRWRLGFQAENLTNQNFEQFNGFPTPGRAFFGTVSWRFDG